MDISTDSDITHVGDRETISDVSDESSFYGDQQLQQRYNKQVESINTDDYWYVHEWNLQVVAARAVAGAPERWPLRSSSKRRRDETGDTNAKTPKKVSRGKNEASQDLALKSLPAKRHNPYEGVSTALQMDQSVDDFLLNLRPSSDDVDGPWIWCANFNADQHESRPNIPLYKQAGSKLLENFLIKRQKLAQSYDPPKSAGVITRMMAADRKNLEENIMHVAKKFHIASGKWMLFPTVDKVDAAWAAVVRGTTEARLGTAAKVATRPDNPEELTQVICVYTKDINDEADVKRVLLELIRLKLAAAIPGPLQKGSGFVRGQIWYKPDCYTYLDISSGNEYKIKPTLYSTSSLLTVADI